MNPSVVAKLSLIAALGLGALPLRALGAEAPQPRSEVAIREVVLSDGARRYAVPVKVGQTLIQAGLDTGSSGLRVLPGVLQPGDADRSGGGDSYSYGSGAELSGVIGKGAVSIGELSAPITLQLISRVGCAAGKPGCLASKTTLAQYGVQGDGLPGEGFKAIIGVNTAGAEIATPLRALGARRWIVELPRPGEAGGGRLVLNPTDEEVAGYAMLPIAGDARQGGLHDAVPGCLVNGTSRQKACGAVLMDSGAPGVKLVNGGIGRRAWDNGTSALLLFYDAQNKARAAESLVIGERAQASHLAFEDGPQRGVVIFAGLSPYFAFSVLYDPARGMIGLKPRDPASGGPKGQLVTP